ncbi:hypothetical protein AUJ26_02225 [Candidatus Falkowbacteria bacterium CG1_02_37_21]|nr:thioredoxin domain-containing protein [Candidatus Falkowbacteria bacterium]OIO05804.1 MAG: hypothetical protein AUJ26_02225 [Candidatus Falkowbacteria bacterium CG1_02_37_21]
MKKNKKLFVSGVALAVIIVVIAIFFFARKSASVSKAPVNHLSGDSSAMTYLALQEPILESDDRVFGDAKAALKIFVYEDYASIYSANLADTLEKIRGEVGDRLSLIVRPYFSSSLDSRLAASVMACAGEQGKWQEMRALLFAKVKNQQADNLDWEAYAKQIALNENNFQTCLTNREKSGTIEQEVRVAENEGVQGAPTMFIGDEIILGARPYDDFVDSSGDKVIGLKNLIENKLQ